MGTKCDIVNPIISTEDGKKLATENGASYFQVSSKSNQGVEELFQAAANALLTKATAKSQPSSSSSSDSPKDKKKKSFWF